MGVRGHKGRRAEGVLSVSCSPDLKDAVKIRLDVRGEDALNCLLPFEGKQPLCFGYEGKGALDIFTLNFGGALS